MKDEVAREWAKTEEKLASMIEVSEDDLVPGQMYFAIGLEKNEGINPPYWYRAWLVYQETVGHRIYGRWDYVGNNINRPYLIENSTSGINHKGSCKYYIAATTERDINFMIQRLKKEILEDE